MTSQCIVDYVFSMYLALYTLSDSSMNRLTLPTTKWYSTDDWQLDSEVDSIVDPVTQVLILSIKINIYTAHTTTVATNLRA